MNHITECKSLFWILFQMTVHMGYEVVTGDTQISSQILDTIVSGDLVIEFLFCMSTYFLPWNMEPQIKKDVHSR